MTMHSKVNLLHRETIYVKEYLEFWVYINVKENLVSTIFLKKRSMEIQWPQFFFK
jgi:hypothetical protein